VRISFVKAVEVANTGIQRCLLFGLSELSAFQAPQFVAVGRSYPSNAATIVTMVAVPAARHRFSSF